MELCPPTARKSHPNFFAHCKRSTKLKKSTKENIKKDYHPKCAKHHENASHPNGFKLWKTINKMICFNIKTPACKRMIHVCLGKISRLLQDASNSNVQSITSTSKKCHLLVRNTMWTHDSYMLWYVWVTNLWGSDLHLNSIFLQWVPKEAKNKAKTRPERGQKIALDMSQMLMAKFVCWHVSNQTIKPLRSSAPLDPWPFPPKQGIVQWKAKGWVKTTICDRRAPKCLATNVARDLRAVPTRA